MVDKIQQISLWASGDAQAVIDEPAVERRSTSLVVLQGLLFDIPHKQACITRPHLGTHRDALGLAVVVFSK